jgi:hypothetical protein
MVFRASRIVPLALLVGCSSLGSSDSGNGGPGYPGAGTGDDGMPPGTIMHCYYGEDDPDVPAATIEHVLETIEGVDSVHVRLTLDPRFVDNTYGVNSIGWGNRGHTYKDLDRSDHAQLLMYDGDGNLAVDFAIDYITTDVSLGVTGGDGDVFTGDPALILDSSTSLHKNLNERGYGSYLQDSPVTDDDYTPDPAAPDWDYRVVYEAWIDLAAFGSAGFGNADVEYIHASPAKTADDTIIVDPDPCPPDWDPEGDCNDPDGCDNDPNDPNDPTCNDPDGCDNTPTDPDCTDPDGCTSDPNDPTDPPADPGGDPCINDDDCDAGEFCAEGGTCLPYVE